MRLSQLGTPKVITLLIASLMVVAGTALTRSSGGRLAAAAPQLAAEPAVRSAAVPQNVTEGAPSTAAVPAAGKSQESTSGPPSAADPIRPGGLPGIRADTPQATGRPAPAKPATSRHNLPPFPPPDFAQLESGASQVGSGPSPDVLWLSGVIEGSPKLALLRRGDNRYLVKEGGSFESYRVVKIASNSVTIQRSSRKRTLRVGQY